MKIGLVGLIVDDPIKAFKFYTEKLGFIERQYMPERQLAIVASPEDPTGPGLLLEPNGNPLSKTFQEGVYAAGLPQMIFAVEDVQQEYARLTALGVNFRQAPTTTEWGTQAILEDTCGNLVQIHQM